MTGSLRILFAGKQHFETGGIEASTDQLARRLQSRGHVVAVVASQRSSAWGTDPVHPPLPLEEVAGYRYQSWSVNRLSPADALRQVMGRFLPDVVVVNAGGSWWHDWTRPLVRAAGTAPCVLYLRDREAADLLADQSVRPHLVLANADSHTTAAREAMAGRLDVEIRMVPSLVEPDDYRVDPAGEVVLYVNPVRSKGVRTAITLAAARRDIPFVFLRSWRFEDSALDELRTMADVLGNIDVAGPTADPRNYYRRARLLLAPYDDYGRPRVVAEAQLSGIPVLGLDQAGLREAVGPGGLLVGSTESPGAWVAALGRMWDDADEHRRLADAALQHSRRPEMDPELVTKLMEEALIDTIARAAKPVAAATRSKGTSPKSHPVPDLVTVVMPVRNVASTIDEQLGALAAQDYVGRWELIISDNASTDGTRGRVLAWAGGLGAEVRIVDASARRGISHARNVGVAAARGQYILICDGDDVVSPQWMRCMVETLHDHTIVTGPCDRTTLNRPEQYEWTGDAHATGPEMGYGYLPYASGGNLGVRRDVALSLAGFDETLRGAEDIDWSWRAQLAGHEIAFEPRAVINYRLRSDLRSLAWSRFRSSQSEAQCYRRYRSRGMAAEPLGDVIGVWSWLARTALRAQRRPDLRNQWVAAASKRAGRVVGSVRHRTVFL